MKATKIVFPASYQVSLETGEIVPEKLGETEILVENHYSLISPGTELAMYTGSHVGFADPDNRWAKYPFRPGYASSGVVIRTGAGVEGIKAGDAVVTSGYHCSHQVFDLRGTDGTAVLKVPQGMDVRNAPFARIAVIPTIMFEVGQFSIGDWSAVFGLGLIGIFAVQLLRLHGARTIGVDPIGMRRAAAHGCGLEQALDPGREEIPRRLGELSGERGVAAVIEATGDPGLIASALKCLRPRGQLLLLGSPRGKADIDVYKGIHASGVRLIGAHGNLHRLGPYRSGRPALEYVLDMLDAGFLRLEGLLTQVMKPEELREAYRLLMEEKDKALGIALVWPAAASA